MKFDRSALVQLEKDVGSEVLPAILREFRTELAHRADMLNAALDAEDLPALQAEAHSLKSTTRTIGFNDAADAASALEKAARAGDAPGAQALARQLTTLCAAAGAMLASMIDT